MFNVQSRPRSYLDDRPGKLGTNQRPALRQVTETPGESSESTRPARLHEDFPDICRISPTPLLSTWHPNQ